MTPATQNEGVVEGLKAITSPGGKAKRIIAAKKTRKETQ